MADDLFGHPVIPDGPVMTLAERRKQQRRIRGEVPKGYYAPPGTGPEGETCKTCAHCIYIQLSKRYYKCAHENAPLWTGGPGTDIRLKSPACRGWEKRG